MTSMSAWGTRCCSFGDHTRFWRAARVVAGNICQPIRERFLFQYAAEVVIVTESNLALVASGESNRLKRTGGR